MVEATIEGNLPNHSNNGSASGGRIDNAENLGKRVYNIGNALN